MLQKHSRNGSTYSCPLTVVAGLSNFPLDLSMDDHTNGFMMGKNIHFSTISPVRDIPTNYWPNSILAELAIIANFKMFPDFEATLYIANGERWASFEFEERSFSLHFEGNGKSTAYLGSFEQLSPHIMNDCDQLRNLFPKNFSWHTTPEMSNSNDRNSLGILNAFAEKLRSLM